MKDKDTKRAEARVRLEDSKWENSKANRTGSATKEQWESAKQKALAV